MGSISSFDSISQDKVIEESLSVLTANLSQVSSDPVKLASTLEVRDGEIVESKNTCEEKVDESNDSNEDCLKRIRAELQTKSEIYLFDKYKNIAEKFQLNCEDSEYGNSLFFLDAAVLIHEATHFEDFGLDANGENFELSKFNLYTVDGDHIGNLQTPQPLPSVKKLVRPYLKKNRPSFLSEDSAFKVLHDMYIGDNDSMAADNIQGMATELNAYAHGAIVQARTLLKLPKNILIKDVNGEEQEISNPYVNMPTQAEGILHFLYNFNLYLKLLKKQQPKTWENFYSAHNKNYLNKLFSSSVEALKISSHCSYIQTFEPINLYVNELNQDDLSILRDIVGQEKIDSLTCKSIK